MGRREIKRKVFAGITCWVLLFLMVLGMGERVGAEGFYENAFLTFAPDHRAWTVQEALPQAADAFHNENPSCWYPMGETINIREKSSAAEPGRGEHVYKYERHGMVPVQKWVVICRTAKCIHNDSQFFHGLTLITAHCEANYYSGWNAYCADCGEKIIDFNLYMSREKVGKITAIDTDLDYYYLCPTCGHLEQGSSVRHKCNAVSANRYRVQYLPNGGNVAGFMQSSFHMYDNAELFEGEPVTPVKTLNLNGYSRPGYLFVGWNSAPDGSGESFLDGQEIWNLTDENYDEKEGTGTVRLYAMWRQVTGVLEIDPNGGLYQGESKTVSASVGYGEKYLLKSSFLTAPSGFLVRFDVQGGEALDAMRDTKCFLGWHLNSPAKGALEGEVYRFFGQDGEKDHVKALYQSEGIILPQPHREGFAFGGWYYDADYTRQAGNAGDRFVPQGDIILYANWVDLCLEAEVNLTAYGGKGAVDLNWRQPDGNQKAYLVYQKQEGEEFQKIYGASEGEVEEIHEEYEVSSDSMVFPITRTGFYRLSASGAQGQDCGDFLGGRGGSAEGVFYLTEGDELKVALGRQEGENAGGGGEKYGGGGGRTEIRSKNLGILVVGGGGGGAGPGADGGEGGLQEGLRPDNAPEGENGVIGGGSGWIGGRAGTYESHIHSVECLHVHIGDEISGGECYGEVEEEKTCHLIVTGPFKDMRKSDNCDSCVKAGRGYGTMHPRCWRIDHSSCGAPTDYSSAGWWVCDVCGREGYKWGSGKNPPSVSDHTWTKRSFVLQCTKEYDCGNPPGKNIPSCGGSSYVNEALAASWKYEPGSRQGEGCAVIEAVNIGFMEDNALEGAFAPDLAGPDCIERDGILLSPGGDCVIQVTFEEPVDHGTFYHHQVHSYLAGSQEVLSKSNITRTEVVTGIAGYYYLVDDKPETEISLQEGAQGLRFSREAKILLNLPEKTGYLHIAAVDRAGNLGGTVSLEISVNPADIPWRLETEQMKVESGMGGREYGSVAPKADEEKVYYVRADGRTPFLLRFLADLLGRPRVDYQIDRMIFEYALGGDLAQGNYSLVIPHGSLEGELQEYEGGSLARRSEGNGMLQAGMYAGAVRANQACTVEAWQSFCLGSSQDGSRILVFPVAGASYKAGIILSERSEDEEHGIWIIGDGKGPDISGLTEAEEILLGKRETQERIVLRARDDGSGLAQFQASLRNLDNGMEAVYYADENGEIQIVLETENPLFLGDLRLELWAKDRVGNVSQAECGAQEFGLKAEIKRLLSPHDPVFKRGESGILIVKARGYADRIEVEFPEELMQDGEECERVFCYEVPMGTVQEEVPFMIPLTVEEDGEYTILVRAFKNGRMLEDRPALCTLTVEETVLGELRTRLR